MEMVMILLLALLAKNYINTRAHENTLRGLRLQRERTE